MNKPIENEKIIIKFTEQQKYELFDKFSALVDHGSVIAQVFEDGFIASVLSPEETKNVAEALQKTRGKFNGGTARTLEEKLKNIRERELTAADFE